MSALDFPNSPVLNQQWTGSNGALYSWDGAVWNITTIQPGTTAGGELAGSYPNPTIAPTTVVAGNYGSSTSIPAFHVRSDGRLDSVTPVAVSIPPGTAIGPNPPASPIPGQLWWRSDPDSNLYIYYDDGDSQQFVAAVPGSMASGVCKIGATPPATPQNGQLWWRNDPDGVLYVYYDDGNSKQFVPAAPIAQNFWSVSGATLTPTDATKEIYIPTTTPGHALRWGAGTGKGRLIGGMTGSASWWTQNMLLNAAGTAWLSDDNTRPSWATSMGVIDGVAVGRAPAGSPNSSVTLLTLDATGNLTLAVTSGNTHILKMVASEPRLELGPTGAVAKTRVDQITGFDAGHFTYNMYWNGSAWTRDDTSKTGCLAYYSQTAVRFGFDFYNAAGAASASSWFDGSGNLTIQGSIGQKASGTTWSNPSDPRLKTDMGPYARGLAEITQLAPISYHLKSDPDGPLCYGFDASAVQAIFPECVGTTTAMLEGEETEVLSFDMHPILVAIVNAIKELAGRTN